MRGKLTQLTTYGTMVRNIPAYAGKTRFWWCVDARCGEHPRVCGENPITAGRSQVRFGTSPRMRGKLPPSQTSKCTWRNIPAYAGKTQGSCSNSGAIQEHPRVCGENRVVPIAVKAPCGTSPRMRGKLPPSQTSKCTWRNIPAYAGKTQGSCSNSGAIQEHPRVCGENRVVPIAVKAPCGTSPRMRGKRFHESADAPDGRNIPAYAGKTGWPGLRSVRGAEHPRVCGENPAMVVSTKTLAGTSPRMRGKPANCQICCMRSRNIPAYAGKTTHVGEKPQVGAGTSPRMRGKLLAAPPEDRSRRNIPAYAGKTLVFFSP